MPRRYYTRAPGPRRMGRVLVASSIVLAIFAVFLPIFFGLPILAGVRTDWTEPDAHRLVIPTLHPDQVAAEIMQIGAGCTTSCTVRHVTSRGGFLTWQVTDPFTNQPIFILVHDFRSTDDGFDYASAALAFGYEGLLWDHFGANSGDHSSAIVYNGENIYPITLDGRDVAWESENGVTCGPAYHWDSIGQFCMRNTDQTVNIVLSVAPAGSGEMCADYQCTTSSRTVILNIGDTVTFHAYEGAGYQFDHFEGPGGSSTQNPVAITISVAGYVKAVFVSKSQPVQITLGVKQGAGQLCAMHDCTRTTATYTFNSGTNVQFAATPDADWQFDHFEGSGGTSVTNPFTLTLTTSGQVFVVFKPAPGQGTTVSIEIGVKQGAGQICAKYPEATACTRDASRTISLNKGEVIDFTATADSGSTFSSFQGVIGTIPFTFTYADVGVPAGDSGYFYAYFNTPNCPVGQYYDPSQQKCVPETTTCPTGQHYDASKGYCVMDENSCPTGSHWDTTLQTCIADNPTCPTGSHWDATQLACIPDNPPTCDSGYHYDASLKACVPDNVPPTCPTGSHWDSAQKACVADSNPHNCPAGQWWSASQNTCVPITPTCPAQSHWDAGLGACISDTPPSCPTGTTWDSLKKACIGVPTCPTGSHYSDSLGACVADKQPTCPSGMEWDATREVCVSTTALSDTVMWVRIFLIIGAAILLIFGLGLILNRPPGVQTRRRR